MLVFTLIRGYGAALIYLYALNTEPVPYLCKVKPDALFEPCSAVYICEMRGLIGLEYKPDTASARYLNNWYVQNDLVCQSKFEVAKVLSWYFISQIFGASLFFLPDSFGRKKSMNFLLVFNVIGIYIVTFYSSSLMKSIGFFLMGFFHLKISLSFCYSTELCTDKDKAKMPTFIQFFDSSLILIAPLIFKYIDKNTQPLLNILLYIGTTGCILFVILVPESPRHIFMKDPNS